MRAKRTDATHRAVIQALRRCGWNVADTHELGRWVDAVAVRGGVIRLIEIKTAKGKLTDSQQRLLEQGWPIHILTSPEDAAALR